MKKACIISIGTEIMKGKINDTNSTYISRWLNSIGIITKLKLSVEDDIDEINNALKISEAFDLIILTGGLGPTSDDCTSEAVARYLNKQLYFDENAWHDIEKFFVNRNLPIANSNKKQAMLISGGSFIPNLCGTAPGIFYKSNDKIYILLPGPPSENQNMISNFLFPILQNNKFLIGDIKTEIIRIYNTGESTIADLFKDLQTKCNIGYYFNIDGYIEIHITFLSLDKKLNADNVESTFNNIIEILNNNNIFYTSNYDLNQLVVEKLKAKNITISFAESITGGSLAGEIVKIQGASNVFLGGIIAYSNEIKASLLNVSQESLNKYGAVSEEVVREMAIELKNIFNTVINVSVSGIAGPSGGSENKPVGLVYFGFNINNNVIIKKEYFFGDRIRIIKRVINFALVTLLKLVDELIP